MNAHNPKVHIMHHLHTVCVYQTAIAIVSGLLKFANLNLKDAYRLYICSIADVKQNCTHIQQLHAQICATYKLDFDDTC